MIIPRAGQVSGGRSGDRARHLKSSQRIATTRTARHDIQGPLRIASARAQEAGAWASAAGAGAQAAGAGARAAGAQAQAVTAQANADAASSRMLEQSFAGFAKAAETFAKSFQTNNVAEISANYQRDIAILKTELSTSSRLDANHPLVTDEMRERFTTATVDENGIEIGVPPESIPTSEVMQEIYDERASAMERAALAGIKTSEGREQFYKSVKTARATAAAQIVGKTNEWRMGALKGKADSAYDAATKIEDPVEAHKLAHQTAKDALDSGAWDYDEYIKNLAEGLEVIDYRAYDKRIRRAETLEQLDDIERQLYDESDALTLSKRHQLLEEIETRHATMDKFITKQVKENNEKVSGAARKAVTLKMTRSKQPLGNTALTEAVAKMTPTDAAAVMTIQRTLQKETKSGTFKTSDSLMLLLTSRIQNLSSPSDEPMNDRRAEMVKMVLRNANVDPETNELTGPLVIASKDLANLMSMIHTVEKRVYSNPQVAQAADLIYTTITKGTKSDMNLTWIKENEFAYQMAREAEVALHRAAETEGPGFDAFAWWNANKGLYITKTMQDNLNKVGLKFGKGIIAYKDADGVIPDLPQTRINAERYYPGKDQLSRKRVRQIMGAAKTAKDQAEEQARKDAQGGKR